jgi:6-pyruvoyltetrahydropterin/6-carboxytetrahydropterin synthase
MTVCAISKEIEFDAGHRVPNHKSKCRNPHGHRYKVQAVLIGSIVEEPGASDEGMLVDFSDLKTILTEKVHDVLDHGFIVYEGDRAMRILFEQGESWKVIIFPYIPTAENIARWIWDQIVGEINGRFRGNLELQSIRVWETPTSAAVYAGEE